MVVVVDVQEELRQMLDLIVTVGVRSASRKLTPLTVTAPPPDDGALMSKVPPEITGASYEYMSTFVPTVVETVTETD
jgi:hypothetical protein